MDKELLEILAIPLAVLGVCVLYLLASMIVSRKRKRLRTLQAEVLTKKIKRVYINKLAKVGVSGGSWFEYYAVFQLESGKKKELQLPQEIYDSIEEGDKGQLSFKDYNFVSFDKNSCYFVHTSQ